MYPIIHLFGREIGTYGLLGMLGLLAAGFVGCRLAKRRYGISLEDVILMTVTVGIGLLIGGHIVYALTNYRLLFALIGQIGKLPFSTLMEGFGSVFGGAVFYGGLFGAFAAAAIYTRHSKVFSYAQTFDLLAVAVPLFHTFGRLGCFFGGCCYGVESHFGFTVVHNPLVPELDGTTRLPIQLIEAACNLLIFLLIYFLFRRAKLAGRLIFVYLPVYAVVRFVLEFFRGDLIRGVFFGLSTSQWISLAILLFCLIRGVVLIVKSKRRTV